MTLKMIAAVALLCLTGCATTADRQATSAADQAAASELDAQIAANRLTCGDAAQCAKLWEAAKRWAALRPHRAGFRLKPNRVFVVYRDGDRNIELAFAFDSSDGFPRQLKIKPGCQDFSLVLIPLSCGLQSRQETLQAEQQIRQSF